MDDRENGLLAAALARLAVDFVEAPSRFHRQAWQFIADRLLGDVRTREVSTEHVDKYQRGLARYNNWLRRQRESGEE